MNQPESMSLSTSALSALYRKKPVEHDVAEARIELGLSPNVSAEMQRIMRDAAREYVLRDLQPPPLRENGAEGGERNQLQVYSKGTLKADSRFSYEVFEIGNVFNETDLRTPKWGLINRLSSGPHPEELLCHAALMHIDGKNWEFAHRFVPRKYRGNGVFSMVRRAFEVFLSARAERMTTEGTPAKQRLSLTTAQLDVISHFLKQGYRPCTEEDASRLVRILKPDDRLFLSYPLDEREKALDVRTSPYVFDSDQAGDGSDPSRLTKTNAYRIELQKTFVAERTFLGRASDWLSARLHEVLAGSSSEK